MKSSQEIRKQFIKFFEKKGHKAFPSAPVIPIDDPTLLFTNAGMNQFKEYFLERVKPEHTRIVNSQKCIRAGGKHNDLEEVGRDGYHHTFFEMLGNWSFGDYYKKEAIIWAWELLTEIWKLPKDKLYVTVHHSDKEAFDLWQTHTDVNPEHIEYHGDKDNFWEMGNTGPCGPCSEIHIDRGENFCNLKSDTEHKCRINGDCHRFIELWNLVFIQFNRDEKGDLSPLKSKYIDTGAGFERICQVLQNVKTNYETDLFLPLINQITELSGVPYPESDYRSESVPEQESTVKDYDGTSHRVIADHVRALTFAIADGGMPSNEGRGYVLRRLLRRASRHGRLLTLNKPFLYQLIDMVIKIMGDHYHEVSEKQSHIKLVIKAEEERFNLTLDNGLEKYRIYRDEKFKQIINLLRSVPELLADAPLKDRDFDLEESIEVDIGKFNSGNNRNYLFRFLEKEYISEEGKQLIKDAFTLKGEQVFTLYDTFGFPPDLTRILAEEDSLTIDEQGFQEEMKQQKSRAREAAKFDLETEDISWIDLVESDKVEFLGYDHSSLFSRIVRYHIDDDNNVKIVLDRTPFYAESGGQVADTGRIFNDECEITVSDVRKHNGLIVHLGKLVSGEINTKPVTAMIDSEVRKNTARNHTATHLLHKALKEVLGDHVQQKGSLVHPDYLRFDFTHYAQVTNRQLKAVEHQVNRVVRECLPLKSEVKPLLKAKEDGAVALFGEKYGNEVRVVSIGDYSMELCGGTHLNFSGEIGFFKITSESSIASGIRRIEAITGERAEKYVDILEAEIDEVIRKLNSPRQNFLEKLEKIITDNKQLHLQLHSIKVKSASNVLDKLVQKATQINGIKMAAARISVSRAEVLRQLGDQLKQKLGSGIGILIAPVQDKVAVMVVVTPDLTKRFHAGTIVGRIANLFDGKGGGRPDMAMAGGKHPAKIDSVLKMIPEILKEY
ncbi:MAG: alanine--tRNA ligase [Candidatus Cloacimonetes bacterium]|nr:alanine--tRNA ligase [Candidatus Cloacimonadota bacterium]